MVTPDELPGGVSPALAISTTINGEVMQKADTSNLVFTAVDLVRYAAWLTGRTTDAPDLGPWL
jgi:acylpyruvate hydrolase